MMKWRALWRALSGCWGPYLVRSATVLPKKHWKQSSSSTSTPLTTHSRRRDLALAPRLPRFPRLLLPRAPRAAHRIRVGSFEEQLAFADTRPCDTLLVWGSVLCWPRLAFVVGNCQIARGHGLGQQKNTDCQLV